MSADNPSEPQGQDSDYDGTWKEALRHYLPEFLRKFFPDLFDLVDWGGEPEWLDKEISQVLGQSGRRNREVDVLVKVRLRDGQPQWILFHLEVQSHYEKDEKELQMPYVTSVERIAKEEGRIEGNRRILACQLARKCGELPEPVQDRLNALSGDQLERRGEDLLEFTNLADLTKWLDGRKP